MEMLDSDSIGVTANGVTTTVGTFHVRKHEPRLSISSLYKIKIYQNFCIAPKKIVNETFEMYNLKIGSLYEVASMWLQI